MTSRMKSAVHDSKRQKQRTDENYLFMALRMNMLYKEEKCMHPILS